MKQTIVQKKEYVGTILGDLPKDWKIVKLGKIAKVSSGGSAPQGIKYFNGDCPFIRVKHINNKDYNIKSYDLITADAVKDYKLKLYPKDTIVFPKSGASVYLEKRAIVPLDSYIVSHLCAVNSNKTDVFQEFLFYVLINIKFARTKSSNYPTLNLTEVKDTQIPLPSYPEQRKISHILSTIQKAKEKTENVINTLKEFKKSMRRHLFTYGPVSLNEIENVELKETEIGEIPKAWGLVSLEDIADINSENLNPAKEIPDDYFIYIDIASVEGETGRIIETKKILGKKAPSRARRIVNTNDVIISTVRPYLKAFTIIPEEYNKQICSTGFAVLRSKENIYPKYLLYALFNDFVGKQFENQMRGSNYPALNVGHVKNTKIPLPSLLEQQKIALILSSINDKIEKEVNQDLALDELFKSMLHNLMTAKIRANDLEF